MKIHILLIITILFTTSLPTATIANQSNQSSTFSLPLPVEKTKKRKNKLPKPSKKIGASNSVLNLTILLIKYTPFSYCWIFLIIFGLYSFSIWAIGLSMIGFSNLFNLVFSLIAITKKDGFGDILDSFYLFSTLVLLLLDVLIGLGF